MAKKYNLSLPSTFTAPRRKRGDIEVPRGTSIEVELSDEQLEAVENDPMIIVREVKDKPKAKKSKPKAEKSE